MRAYAIPGKHPTTYFCDGCRDQRSTYHVMRLDEAVTCSVCEATIEPYLVLRSRPTAPVARQRWRWLFGRS